MGEHLSDVLMKAADCLHWLGKYVANALTLLSRLCRAKKKMNQVIKVGSKWEFEAEGFTVSSTNVVFVVLSAVLWSRDQEWDGLDVDLLGNDVPETALTQAYRRVCELSYGVTREGLNEKGGRLRLLGWLLEEERKYNP